jgi:ABC-type polysaccharide/polyol phosphate transport system ATPase subunit
LPSDASLQDRVQSRRGDRLAQAPVAIEVSGVDKAFQIPRHRIDSLKERLTHPFTRQEYRTLQALRNISFEVRQGEFFGILGRNGSGKSTLLKIMASIYRPDSGRVRVAGRMAPFIELGVGFNPELSSRENVLLNGVLMGLSRREAARKLDAVLEFAELQEFADLKLKNYSSGMMVRLAFAVMVEADADIMLVDEVLAVGDAAFSQKCLNVFSELRERGRTIVLVTHDMPTAQRFCDRAMLIHDSETLYLGDVEETALRYYRLNFGGDVDHVRESGMLPDVHARVLDVWLENSGRERIQNVEANQPFVFNCLIEARRDLEEPVFSFQFLNDEGVEIAGFTKFLENPDGSRNSLLAGQQVLVSGEVENAFLPGRYHLGGWVVRNRTAGDWAFHALRLLEFTVYGTDMGPGNIKLRENVQAVVLQPGEGR